MSSQPPIQPTLSGYLAFLYSVPAIPPANLPSAQGTATAGSTTTLTDTVQNWTVNQWAGYVCTDTVQNSLALVQSNTSNTLTFAPPPLSAAIAPGDAYAITPQVVSVSLRIAQDIVNTALNVVPDIYTLAVYNLAADRLINYAPDVPEQTYFADVRKSLSLNVISVGVAAQASDQGTAVSLLNPEQFRLLTLQDLQTLKTPYGRQYMAFAQMYGRSLWGLS